MEFKLQICRKTVLILIFLLGTPFFSNAAEEAVECVNLLDVQNSVATDNSMIVELDRIDFEIKELNLRFRSILGLNSELASKVKSLLERVETERIVIDGLIDDFLNNNTNILIQLVNTESRIRGIKHDFVQLKSLQIYNLTSETSRSAQPTEHSNAIVISRAAQIEIRHLQPEMFNKYQEFLKDLIYFRLAGDPRALAIKKA